MKYLILLITVFVSAISLAQSQNVLSMLYTLHKCKQIHGAKEDIQGCLLRMALPKDERSYCAIACVMRDIGLMYEDYSVDENETQTLLKKFGLPIPSYMFKVCNKRVIETMNIANDSENDYYYIDEDECQAVEILMRCINELRNESS